jgi:hypothetical protein
MLRAFLFVLSLLTDYQTVSQALQTGIVWGVVNTSIFAGALICAYLRKIGSSRSDGDALGAQKRRATSL